MNTHVFTITKKTGTSALLKDLTGYPTVRSKVRRYKLILIELAASGVGGTLVTDKEHADNLRTGDFVFLKTLGGVFDMTICYTDNHHQIIPSYTFIEEYRKDLHLLKP